jgi:SAM-dependent methyltransferase
VIDLGCGTGAAGRALHTANSQLRVTGIDVAQIPKSCEPALNLLTNVAMESLPFPDQSFGAAVSQFGYEYGEPQASAKELARVLMPGAPFSFLIHHPDGPIVRALRRQRRAIEGLCGLRVQAAFFSGNETALAERIAILKCQCSDDLLIEQAERGLQTQIHQDELGRLQVWKAVVEALAPELYMLDSLPLCCHEEHTIDDLVYPLTRSFEVKSAHELRSRSGEPIALIIEGVRL